MRLWPRRERAPLTRQAMLQAIPRKVPEVESKRGSDGLLLLTLRRPDRGWPRILSYLVVLPHKRTFQLDERGEWFWELCDGKRTVEQLGEAVAKKLSVGRETARKMAFEYAGLMTRRGLMGIEIPAKALAPSARGKEKKRT